MSSTSTKDAISGQDAILETVRLLTHLTFDPIRGAIAESEGLLVNITPTWENEERTRFRAKLSCNALWHRQVNWETLRVSARPKETSGFFIQYVLPLDHRGRAMFRELKADEYELRVYYRGAEFKTPAPSQAIKQAAGHLGATQKADTARGAGALSEIRPLARQTSPSEEEVVVLIGQRDGLVVIEFGTNDSTLAGKEIEFCAVDKETREIFGDAQRTAFSKEPTEGEFKYRSEPIELDFLSEQDVEVSFCILE